MPDINSDIADQYEYELPRITLDIMTCEWDDEKGKWNPVLVHSFLGNSRDEIDGYIESHMKTDAFFAASFTGEFQWKGGTIKLKNLVSDYLYTY